MEKKIEKVIKMKETSFTVICMFIIMSIVALLLTACALREREVTRMDIAKEKVLQISNREAEKLGYNLSELTVNIDDKNSLWEEYIKSGPILEYDQALKNTLENKEYWAIYYRPKRLQKGGDLFVFIDKHTGEVLTSAKGK